MPTRKAMMEPGLNFSVSRAKAESSRVRTKPATTNAAPRTASFSRQRFRISRMMPVSSERSLVDTGSSSMLCLPEPELPPA